MGRSGPHISNKNSSPWEGPAKNGRISVLVVVTTFPWNGEGDLEPRSTSGRRGRPSLTVPIRTSLSSPSGACSVVGVCNGALVLCVTDDDGLIGWPSVVDSRLRFGLIVC